MEIFNFSLHLTKLQDYYSSINVFKWLKPVVRWFLKVLEVIDFLLLSTTILIMIPLYTNDDVLNLSVTIGNVKLKHTCLLTSRCQYFLAMGGAAMLAHIFSVPLSIHYNNSTHTTVLHHQCHHGYNEICMNKNYY